ncbi:hypothetical protein, partial [Streptomyces sp. NPDC056387]|uniref:hypothetical protein n=1 Tax=Streptomyces sp. NPDC056387 TaxID=3345803 RepID=UPI0035D760EE
VQHLHGDGGQSPLLTALTEARHRVPGLGRTAELAVRAVAVGYVADWWAAERVESPRSDGRGTNYAWLWDSS